MCSIETGKLIKKTLTSSHIDQISYFSHTRDNGNSTTKILFSSVEKDSVEIRGSPSLDLVSFSNVKAINQVNYDDLWTYTPNSIDLKLIQAINSIDFNNYLFG